MITLRPTTISTSSTATESTTETSTSTGVAAGGGDGKGDDDGDDDNSLSRDQVAGISVGVLAAAGLAIGAILLARYYRHKKYPGMKTGFLPMRDTWGYKPSQSDSNKTNSWVAHQMPPPLDGFVQPPAPAYNRASYKPSAIGLALSPAQSRTTTQTLSPLRRISRLLPAKPVLPVLPLNISKRKSAPPPQDEWPGPQHYGGESRRDNIPRLPPLQITPSASLASMASPGRSRLPPPAPPKLQIPNPEGNNPMAPPSSHYQRESTMTEFEDDERASMSASAQVWRPPATPLSAATYYVADQYGNWVLGNAKNASQAPESQAAIPKPPPKDNANAPPAGILKVKNQDYVSPLSSDDSKTSLAPPAEIVSARWQASEAAQRPMGPRAQPYPNPLFSAAQSNPRRNSSNRRSLTRSLTRPRATSGSSDVTTITTSSEESSLDPTPPLEQQVNLSPVAESPHSSGRSPVAYPKIPTRDPKRISRVMNQNLNKRTAPPPTRPMVYYPPGQPSPTLGTMQPPSGPGMASNSAPKAGRKPAVNPGLPRSGSPTMRIVEPSPEPEEGAEEEQQRPAPPPKTRAPPFYFAPPYPQPLKSGLTSNPRGSAPGSGQPPTRPYRPYQPQQQQQQVSQRSYQNPLEEQQQQQLPQRSYQNPQQEQQQQPQRPYRIPQQQQHPLHHPYQQHQQQPQHQLHDNHHQWHPLQPPRKTNPDYNPSFGSDHSSSSSSLLAKRVGSDRAANMTIPTDPSRAKWRREDVSSQEASTPGRELPSTPTWLPRLTPTRRGQDLFLNVQ
ncbi:hypothetical protein QQZ08_001631 [Neonectria magnoliae]|uniref:Uncharacterized protein n=1 Tax=Neonectria magnoliae TaxID=2732573 RepID=A0ABR1IDS6_9HYPO